MDDLLLGYKYANDLSIQLISLATGILALSVTFLRDMLKENSPVRMLKIAWILLLLSVISGIWAMSAITANIYRFTAHPELLRAEPEPDISNQDNPIKVQIISFIGGVSFMIVFGARTLKQARKNPAEAEE